MEFPMTIRSLAAAASVIATFLTKHRLTLHRRRGYARPDAPFAVAAVQGTAPNFAGISNWFNSAPLSMADLRGKVVLVDFWTYGCVNCVNTLPHVTELYAKYKDRGLAWWVSTRPEFPFGGSASNVQAALKRHGITYPVAQETNSRPGTPIATSIGRRKYIIDQSGKIVFQHDGEGQYEANGPHHRAAAQRFQ